MSARESIENLWDRATPVGPLLDAYAHELAEKQRKQSNGFAALRSERAQGIATGLRMGADMIDPEVLNSEQDGAVQRP